MPARLTSLVLFLVLLTALSARADTGTSTPTASAASQPLHFIVNITPKNRNTSPWTGDMTLRINPEGIINGTYRSTSIRPDPFHGSITTVTGGLQGKNIHLNFGTNGPFSVKGDYHPGEGIIATGLLRSGGRTAAYDFIAKQEAK